MGTGAAKRGMRLLAITAALVAVPASVFAHARLLSPKPRNTNDGIKNGPCGAIAKTGTFVQYDAGATVTVVWQETIDHSGCFDIVLATTGQVGDAAADPQTGGGWIRLARFQDDAGTPDASRAANVTLPAGVTCETCTLALRQVMANATGGICPGGNCICQANTPDEMDGGPPTYFSCADIRIGDFPDAAPSVDSGSDEDSGVSTTPTDGGGKLVDASDNGSSGGAAPRRLGPTEDGCSCHMGGAETGVSAFFCTGIAALAVLRRRRRRR